MTFFADPVRSDLPHFGDFVPAGEGSKLFRIREALGRSPEVAVLAEIGRIGNESIWFHASEIVVAPRSEISLDQLDQFALSLFPDLKPNLLDPSSKTFGFNLYGIDGASRLYFDEKLPALSGAELELFAERLKYLAQDKVVLDGSRKPSRQEFEPWGRTWVCVFNCQEAAERYLSGKSRHSAAA